uniref:Transposase n=1 Tax=Hordeum vulgare subsp. vulgare TaxID=112509 RepID=A0A8I6XAG0_HORVV
MAEEEEGAREGHAMDTNLMVEEEEGARDGHAIDLNLMAEEEEGARDGHAIDLNLMAEEEEGAREGHAMDTNLMVEEEEQAREEEADAQGNAKKKELTDNERFGIYFALRVIELRDGEVHLYDKVLVATLMNVCVRTVSRIWNLAKEQLDLGQEVNVSSKKKGNVGRKRKELDMARTATIPLNRRRTIRSLARCLGVPYSTLHDRFQLKELKRITNTVKPFLKPANKIARLKFCISMMDEHSISTPYPSFKSMNNMVHIDEKWYDMTRVKNTYYVLPGEREPERTVSNTNSIGKVMFLTAVAKPRYNDEGQLTFDGKIGTWAFVVETEAQRNSQNRDRGTGKQ